MPSIFDAFQPLDEASKLTLVNYNKCAAVDSLANALATDAQYKNKIPLPQRNAIRDRATAQDWLKSLMPAVPAVGDWRLEFVKNFAQKWVRDKYPGNAEALALAVEMSQMLSTARGLKPTMDYYTQVRGITVDDTSQFKGDFDGHVKKNWSGVKRIGWRGDDRDPDTMMKNGFSPRVSTTTPIWRPQEAFKDVDLDTTVCVARDIRGSAFFPLSKPVKYTWAYCVLIREGWNTYYLQKKLAEENNIQPNTADYHKTVWMFHEKCVSRIEPKDIVIAIQLERRIFDGNDPLSGIQFRLNTTSGRTNFKTITQLEGAQRKVMDETISQFSKGWYPSKPNEWLTYGGVVTK